MEENENNIQNQTNANVEKKEAPKGNKAKGLVVAVFLILFLGIGFGLGVIFTGKWNPFVAKNNTAVNNTAVNNTAVNNAVENKSSKKIDESKPWVYDAEYCINNENKKAVGLYEGEEFNTKEYLKVPYINVNSEYAKKANEEIKEIYEKLYNAYGEDSGGVQKAGELKYDSYAVNNILSIAIIHREGVTNAGWSKEYIIYNINLETLKEATWEEVYKACGFTSKDVLKDDAEIALLNAIDESDGALDKTELNYNKCFISESGFNLLIPNGVGQPDPLVVKPGVTRIGAVRTTENEKENNNTNTNTNNTVNTVYSYKEEYAKIIDEFVTEYGTDIKCDLIYFNNDNIPDLVVNAGGLSLYMYEAGKVNTLMKNEPIGIGGSKYYDYLERKGTLYNYGNGYAGAISQVIIKVLNSKRDFDEFKIISAGADIEPTNSMYEEVKKELAETAGHYYNGKKISEEEFNNKLNDLSVSSNVKDYKGLTGSKSVDEIKKALQK